MFLIQLNWNLEYSTYFHRRFQIISLNITKSITILQEMPKITEFIKPKKFSLIEQYEQWSYFITLWNSLDSKLKYFKTAKHFKNEFKSSLVNNYD